MKWEYKVFKLFSIAHIAINEIEEDVIRANADTLKVYGNDGWELVSVDNGIAYFKRPLAKFPTEYRTYSEVELEKMFPTR